jgi:hypothetical protein
MGIISPVIKNFPEVKKLLGTKAHESTLRTIQLRNLLNFRI